MTNRGKQQRLASWVRRSRILSALVLSTAVGCSLFERVDDPADEASDAVAETGDADTGRETGLDSSNPLDSADAQDGPESLADSADTHPMDSFADASDSDASPDAFETSDVVADEACSPSTCGVRNCGDWPDGCGGTLHCGTCTAPDICGSSGICGCTPTWDCTGKCGTIKDTCGVDHDCGACTPPDTCGGGGVANVCGCTPLLSCPSGKNCGLLSNGCGGFLSCGPTCAVACSNNACATAASVSAGGGHACAVLTDGTIWCWGLNSSGELGDGTKINRNKPTQVAGISNALEVAAGVGFTCAALGASGSATVECWGYNGNGQLGDGTTSDHALPAPVSGIGTAVHVASGGNHACAILADHSIQCWGQNFYGELGNGSTTDSSTPVAVTSISTAVSLGLGHFHSCAALSDGTGRCWGNGAYGKLGNGVAITKQSTPVTVAGLTTVVAISVGDDHSCAGLSGGSISCWGHNIRGQLGNGSTTDSLSPVTVTGVAKSNVASGNIHVCAFGGGTTAFCWGDDSSGELGNGTTTVVAVSTAVAVSGLSAIDAVASGDLFSCALLHDGSLWCWGTNSAGSLGDGTTVDHNSPAVVRFP
jgi:alpha-tubulin suppressor-like RCC1 family protein